MANNFMFDTLIQDDRHWIITEEIQNDPNNKFPGGLAHGR
jgi:hypothetical protein